MGQVAITLDDATEAVLHQMAQAAGIPLHRWLGDLIRRRFPTGCDTTALIVDDDPICREVLRCQVESLGWRGDTAVNGAEALAMLNERDYRLILTDCRMPVMDGFQLVHAIRSRERRLRLLPQPIVAVTSERNMTDAEFCHELGFDHCLQKPTCERILASVLSRWRGPEPASLAVSAQDASG